MAEMEITPMDGLASSIAKLCSKMDNVVKSVDANTLSLQDLKQSFDATSKKVEEHSSEIESLKTDNSKLTRYIGILEGRINRLELKSDQHDDDLEDLRLRSMRLNVCFYNVPEQKGEDVKLVVLGILTKAMGIPIEAIRSSSNLAGSVMIDVAHRFGGGRTRPIVVRFSDRSGQMLVMSHAKNLRNSSVNISDQLPNTMNRKHVAQLPKLKSLRSENNGVQGFKAHLNRGVLVVNGVKQDPGFVNNPLDLQLKDISPDICRDDIAASKVHMRYNNIIQGFCCNVADKSQAKAALATLISDCDVSNADHRSYAYR
ncbi:unnamed protein product [Owenia fusiformis]|uniref:Uncharacterized protein n=1 Tax=Owenia fusiformis TaxID=6347 RepID=A0A8J1Y1A3_OWEFU|nr:unnamed protein product [Owenia fusiformis]